MFKHTYIIMIQFILPEAFEDICPRPFIDREILERINPNLSIQLSVIKLA